MGGGVGGGGVAQAVSSSAGTHSISAHRGQAGLGGIGNLLHGGGAPLFLGARGLRGAGGGLGRCGAFFGLRLALCGQLGAGVGQAPRLHAGSGGQQKRGDEGQARAQQHGGYPISGRVPVRSITSAWWRGRWLKLMCTQRPNSRISWS